MPTMTVEEMLEFAEGRITEDLMRKAQKFIRKFARSRRLGGRPVQYSDEYHERKRMQMRLLRSRRKEEENKKGEGVQSD